jgi:iron(III) transport system ATP-binding protein
MVTHDPEEAMFMADRILVMNEGRVVQDGTPVELYSSPKDTFVAEFFGPVNKFQSTVHNSKVDTPVGVFDADGQKDGTQVDVLVRPEGFRLANADEKPHAMPGDNLGNTSVVLAVVNARPLGRSSYVAFKLSTGQVIETRVPGLFLPSPGDKVSVSVNAHQAHVFASTIILEAR